MNCMMFELDPQSRNLVFPNPIDVWLVTREDRKGENLRTLVRVVGLDLVADSLEQRRAGLRDQDEFCLVVDLSLPRVDGTYVGDQVHARGEFFLEQGGRDSLADLLAWNGALYDDVMKTISHVKIYISILT
jgi:hypothetical protein